MLPPALDFPAPRRQAQDISNRHLRGLRDFGQSLPACASRAPLEPAQGLGGDSRVAFALKQRVPGWPPGDKGLGQVTQPTPALTPIAPTAPAEAPRTQGRNEGAHAVHTIPQKQGARGDLFQGSGRLRQFGRHRISMADQRADEATVQLRDGRQRARQPPGAHVPCKRPGGRLSPGIDTTTICGPGQATSSNHGPPSLIYPQPNAAN